MSGPYRFAPDSTRSPLDRRPQNPLPAQPVSFKTNVNRMKTQKWVQAKKNAYDGDDWGDYDEYDEYGAEPSQPAAPPARGYGDRYDPPGRSFTDPHRQGPPQLGRRNSFEAGEEQRAFSASMGPPPPQGPQENYTQPQQPQQPASQQFVHPALRQASGAPSDTSDTPEHRRDFSPSAMPPPLQTRISPLPAGISNSGGQSDAPAATSPRDRAPSNPGKPLPFIRPADIYKRYEEERASLDEQRPTLDSASGQDATRPAPPMLPPVQESASTFDSELRSVVDQAFTRTDDQRSVPPTPISKSDSGVSRSNTDSTSGISPIMSRVPSSAASALKARNQAGGDGSTPVIAEETSESNTPVVSRPTSAVLLGSTHQIPRKASPGHSRNVSSSSIPLGKLSTPEASGSPARSPAIGPHVNIPEPITAELSTLSPPLEATQMSPSADATTREADIAEAMKMSPITAMPELRAAEQESQKSFLESHHASSTVADAVPRPRSESPNKGRVQELAGRFGDVSPTRRGSAQSNASLESWEKSHPNSRPTSVVMSASPTKEHADTRPPAEREVSFRPQLPGQWESYTTSAATPLNEKANESGGGNLTPAALKDSPPLEEVDLTPTTAKHSVSPAEPSKTDPVSLATATGAAVAGAAQTSLGLGSSEEEEQKREQFRGEVLPRPLLLHREESAASTIPPTPPAKDTPASEHPPPAPLEDSTSMTHSSITADPSSERPIMLPQLSVDSSVDEQESDRLRREIVASLSPQQSQILTKESDISSLHANNGLINRESSLFPSEYESYWADGDRPSQETGQDQNSSDIGKSVTANALTQSPEDVTKPSVLTRFSWEGGASTKDAQKDLQDTAPEGAKQIEAAEQVEEDQIPKTQPDTTAAKQENGYFPEPYFGPTHDIVGKPEPVADADLNARSLPTETEKLPTSPSLADDGRTPSPPQGLHVVNSALHPEAVDLPPRLSREVSPVSDQVLPSQATALQDSSLPKQEAEKTPVSAPVTSAPARGTQEPATTSPVSDKPLTSRDIVNMKSPVERITNYNKAREQWARTDYGLSEWITTAIDSNPDVITQPYTLPRPNVATSGTLRHRPTGSLSLFGKHGTSTQQAEASSPSSPYAPTNPLSMSQGSGRSASHQMQAKGKDLLHTAGVLSGKGMTGAKGLFAKGKSRFKSDKVSESEPSSREASEEPSDIASDMASTASDRMSRISFDTADGAKEEKKRRRFSSPFHRSSRSRSRPNSAALSSIDSTPRGTPSHSRPQSYHPPESWNYVPSSLSGSSPAAVDRESPEQLGVLPSPAKSAFSLLPQDHDCQVPPVPPFPDETVLGEPAQVSHRLLQSVMRNSSPPLGEPLDMEAFSPQDGFKAEPAESNARLHQLSTESKRNDGDGTFAYETELIGGDVSPVSRHPDSDEEQKTPTKADGLSHPSEPSQTSADKDEPLRAPRPRPPHQVSSYRVVHAVQLLSQSSFGSWDQESNTAPSHSDGSPYFNEHSDEQSDSETPFSPRLPSPSHALEQTVLVEQAPSRAESPGSTSGHSSSTRKQKGPSSPIPGSPLAGPPVPIISETATHQGSAPQSPQLDTAMSSAETHKRSESILSRISSMVSADGGPISPASSYGPRSRPPSATRQRHVPSAKTSPIPVQIMEEPGTPDHDPDLASLAANNNDFDLYADHSGAVKDADNAPGRPLLVATDEVPATKPAASPLALSSGAKPSQLPKSMENAPGRASDERPMSFVWGSRDVHGRAQDEINGNDTRSPFQRSNQNLNGLVSNAKVPKNRPQSSARLLQNPPQGDLGSKNVSPLSSHRESNKSSSPPPSNISSSPANNASPPLPASPPLSLSERPMLNESNQPIRHPQSKLVDQRLIQDPRQMVEAQLRGNAPLRPSSQDPRSHGQVSGLGVSMPKQLHDHPTAPKDQYTRQQAMVRQTMQPSELKNSPAITSRTKKEEKSSRVKLSSVFKSLGKSTVAAPHIPQAPPPVPPQQPASQPITQAQSRVSPPMASMGPMPMQHGRSASLQSGVSDLTTAQMTPRKDGAPSAISSALTRPSSLGDESHGSQESTRVQISESRIDLRQPANPLPAHGIPARPLDPVPAMAYSVPETGKKKRFSSLGNIFNRSSTTGYSFPTKAKFAKEDKRAQKAQKQLSTIPMQAPHPQPWPVQQSLHQGAQPVSPNAYSMQHDRSLPGPVQSAPLQHTNQQMMPPNRLPGAQAQDISQQYQQPAQGFEHPPVYQPNPAQEQSAYINTRQAVQRLEAQRVQNQSRPPTQQSTYAHRPDGFAEPNLFNQSLQQMERTFVPPINEYFKPDPSSFKTLPAIPQQESVQMNQIHPSHLQQQQQQPHPQQLPVSILPQQRLDQTRSVSAPVVPLVGPISQLPSAPPVSVFNEPQYETPPVPAAYTHVQGAFVSPGVEQTPFHNEGYPPMQARGQQPMPQAPGFQLDQTLSHLPPHVGGPHSAQVHPQQQPSYVGGSHSAQAHEQQPSSHVGGSQVVQSHSQQASSPAEELHVVQSHVQQVPSRNEPQRAPSYDQQYFDPQMQTISPQVSNMTSPPANMRQNSSDSVVSPISNASPGSSGGAPQSNSRPQAQRMTSITEQAQSERPWNLNLPQGATEQEIVRARQRQYMEQQLAAQEQLHAERTGRSPSPRNQASHHSQPHGSPPAMESGGFRELLPRSSPQGYSAEPQSLHGQERQSQSPPIAPIPVRPGPTPTPASHPLPRSEDSMNVRSPVNPAASIMPPPPLPQMPRSPRHPDPRTPPLDVEKPSSNRGSNRISNQDLYEDPPPPIDHYQHPAHRQRASYEEPPPADEPPPYSGPGVPNDGMDKDRPRPPSISTEAANRIRHTEARPRQASIGILQHPQPANMAASPQRSSADMGANILQQQMLEQEARDRRDRRQREEIQRVESARERAERERARARARELERSVSGGGVVGSLRSQSGSTRTNATGQERGPHLTVPVYELPAEEDDEPVMRATSFPGQEWVPTWTDD